MAERSNIACDGCLLVTRSSSLVPRRDLDGRPADPLHQERAEGHHFFGQPAIDVNTAGIGSLAGNVSSSPH